MIEDPDKHMDRWFDGELDDEGIRELNAWITESPENADHFAERSHLHSRLYDWAKAIGSCGVDEMVESVGQSVAFQPVKIRWQTKALAAAIVIGLVSLFLFNSAEGPKRGEPVATLMESPGASLLYYGRSLEEGDAVLRTGTYRLDQGIASVAFETGVTLLIEAPADFRLVSGELVELSSGKISAHVPPEGIGFRIETPSAEVIDYGTDFAVEVGADRSSEVHVFDGEVKVQPRQSQTEPVRLLTNAATRIEFESDVPLGIPVDEDRFLRSLDEPPIGYSKVIRDQGAVLHYRMGIPEDGVMMKDVAGDSHGILMDRGSRRPPFAPGRVGASLRFEGPKDGAYLFTDDYPKSEGTLTVSAWVNPESWPRLGCIVANDYVNTLGQMRLGFHKDSGVLKVRVRDQENKEVSIYDSEPLALNRWHHIAFVADGKTLRLFRNGKVVAHTECGMIGKTRRIEVPNLFVGAQDNREGDIMHFWHGRIDEVAIFNDALSDEEIMRQFRSAPPN